jgi:hypothetical protein
MGEWRYSFTILDFGTIWRCMVGFTLRTLYLLRGTSPVPIAQECGWSP